MTPSHGGLCDSLEYDKGHPRLDHAVPDVEKVAVLLEGSFDGCSVLRDPVEQEARDCLRGLRDSISERGGSLVLLWSGHAIPSPADGLRLLTRDSGDRRSDGLGANSDVAAPCAESGASQLLLIVDTCFSGEAVCRGEQDLLWIRRMPSTAQVRASQALANGAPLSALCRRRHNADYADLRIMPIPA